MSTIIGYSPEITAMLKTLKTQIGIMLEYPPQMIEMSPEEKRRYCDSRFDIIIGSVGLKDLSKVEPERKGLPGIDQWPNTASLRQLCEAADKSNPGTCSICGSGMVKGMALENSLAGSDDGFGATLSQTGPAEIVDCMKCPTCGHSVHIQNITALTPSSPATPSESPERVETAELNSEWLTADFEWPSGNPTPWTIFIDGYREGDGTFKAFNLDDMKSAFRAGYEAGRKAK